MMRRRHRALLLALAFAVQHAARAAAQTPAQAAPADTVKRHTESNATRLFFAPTGRTLEAHRGYIADYYLIFPMVAYGVTDRLTLAAGMSIVPTVKFQQQIFYFSPKLGVVRSARFNAALGVLVIRPPGKADICTGDNNPDGTCKRLRDVGIAYGAGTWGSTDASVTAGLGFGFVNRSFSSDPFITLGGNKRVSRKIALITENWFVPAVDKQVLISYGVRFLGESLTVDFAFATPSGKDAIFPGVPYLDFAFHF
jgi:hypothetical protein